MTPRLECLVRRSQLGRKIVNGLRRDGNRPNGALHTRQALATPLAPFVVAATAGVPELTEILVLRQFLARVLQLRPFLPGHSLLVGLLVGDVE